MWRGRTARQRPAAPPNVMLPGVGESHYVVFTAALLDVVGIDLITSARRHAPPSARGAAVWVAAWLAIAAGFGVWIGHVYGTPQSLTFFAAYLTEEALSLDNMMVFVAVFGYFAIPSALQHRVLGWGILGAVLMRALMIVAGVELLDRVGWITYAFGAFLVVGGLRLLRPKQGEARTGGGVLRVVNRIVPVTSGLRGAAFFCREAGRFAVTPLFVTLVVIELTDVVFATDSIPAVFGVTRDPYLVYTSNILAVLGMRSLYFLIAGVLPRLRFLRYGLAAILVFVGGKMLAADVVDIPIGVSLGFIVLALAVATAASIGWSRRRDHR
ncbi:MAG: TerC/Alx family metal homeostasis membrane protein [Gemmatimonadaceae bacterium]